MQDGRKGVWSISYASVVFFPRLKQNFIAYCSSKVSSRPDWIFEIHQPWQSGFSRMYSNCCCSCSFEPEIIKISQSSHKMYSSNILHFQESKTILNSCTKKVWKLFWIRHVLGSCSQNKKNEPWKMRDTMISIVIGEFRMVFKGWVRETGNLPKNWDHQDHRMVRSARILERVLVAWRILLSQGVTQNRKTHKK